MSSTIFSGDKIKTLLPALGLGDNATIRSGTINPQSVATAGIRGDIYIRTGANATIYQKITTDGTDTNWQLIPSSLGSLSASSVVVTDTLGNIKTDGGLLYDSTTDILTNDGIINTPSLQRATSGILAIGNDGNSTTINIGTTGSTINLQGTTVYQNVTNANVANKQINLNVGGGVGTATNSGIEIQENNIVTGYVQTSSDRNSWQFLAPNTAGIVTLTPGAGGFTLNQGSHNPVTLAAVGSSPNANGASLSTQVLNLQPADGTNPGVLTAGTQTIGGAKTFSSTLTAANIIDSGLTANTALTANASKQLVSSSTTDTELGFVNGVTSSIQTQLNGKQATGNYITALTGDATASGPGSVALTLATVNSNIGSFGSSTAIPSFTVNAKGLITAASTNVVIAPASTLTGTTLASNIVTSSLTSLGPQSATLNMNSHLISSVTDPVSAQDAATKAYVDAGLAALNPMASVRAATTSASDTSSYTYLNGVAGIGATFTGPINTPLVVDGVTFNALGQRLLVKNDTQSPSGAFNGIYYVTQLSGLAAPVILTRALDFDQPSDINNAGLIPVINGTVNALSSWDQIATITTVGTDALVFSEFTANPSLYLLKANNLNDVASKTASFDNLSPMTTLGDIIYGGASGTGTRLAKGTQYQVLQAGSTIPLYDAVHLDQSAAVTGILPVANGGTGFSSALSIGTINSQAGVANGLQIISNILYAQYATVAVAGMVSATSQTFGGAKTFNSSVNTDTIKNQAGVTAIDVLSNLLYNTTTGQWTVDWIDGLLRDNAGTPKTSIDWANRLLKGTDGTTTLLNWASTSSATLTGTASGNLSYTPNNHGVLLSGTGNVVTVIAPDASTVKVLVSGGTGADPTWQTITNSNLSGSAAITNANLATMANNTVKGNTSGGTATPSDLSLVSTATASTVMYRDSNANTAVNAIDIGFTTATVNGGTTTLTAASSPVQWVNAGGSNQTFTLPVVSTLGLGHTFTFYNNNSGSLTINSSGGNLVMTIPPSSNYSFYSVATSGTTAAAWGANFLGNYLAGGGSNYITPTVQKFTSGSGTYTTPATVKYIKLRMAGGGGGGDASGTGGFGTTATSGGNSTFGANLTATGGGASGGNSGSGSAGGAGNTNTATTGTVVFNIPGQPGQGGRLVPSSEYNSGALGGNTPFLGGGGSQGFTTTGGAGTANTGGGGQGGGNNLTTAALGGGGASGGFLEVILVPTVGQTFSYSVGSGGTGTGAGTNGHAGGAGAAGVVVVEEYYA